MVYMSVNPFFSMPVELIGVSGEATNARTYDKNYDTIAFQLILVNPLILLGLKSWKFINDFFIKKYKNMIIYTEYYIQY